MGRGRRIEQWQQLDPPFPFRGHEGRRDDVDRDALQRRRHLKVDDKGRVLLPSHIRSRWTTVPKFHRAARPELVIVYGDDDQRHLEVYTAEAMAEVRAKVDRITAGPDARAQRSSGIRCQTAGRGGCRRPHPGPRQASRQAGARRRSLCDRLRPDLPDLAQGRARGAAHARSGHGRRHAARRSTCWRRWSRAAEREQGQAR